MRKTDSTITEVAQGSPAERAGLRTGDMLVSLTGHPIYDILDCRFHGADEEVTVEVLRDGKRLVRQIRKDLGEDLGLEFAKELFDGVRTCRNNCIFCFLNQMPSGLRKSLYVRDDDFRLSFAHGNYITLTNLSDNDVERICSQKMSPMYVSVHSTEPEIREYMLGSKRAGRIIKQLRRLADAGITVHAQIVLCPGVNDGKHLERTVRDLSTLHPSVASVAIVPVGLTRYREGLTPIRPVGPDDAIQVLDGCVGWQREFRRTLGTRFVFPADELYLLADRPFPSRSAYEGFPQLEDGVGVSRLFLDELRRVEKKLEGACVPPGKYILVTGVLASRLLQDLAWILNRRIRIRSAVCTVRNKFLGETVTVAGLLAGHDIARALGRLSPDEIVLIPSVALKDGLFLDDMSLEELAEATSARVEAVEPSPAAVFRRVTARTVSPARRAGT